MTYCVFCGYHLIGKQIIKEEKYFYVLENNRPITDGHLLIITKRHIRDFKEFTPVERKHYACILYFLGKKTYRETGRNMFMFTNSSEGQSVPHFHTHIIPNIFKPLEVEERLVKAI